MKKLKCQISYLLSLTILLGICVLPAQAHTVHTVTKCEDYLIFEGGIVNVEWEIDYVYKVRGNTIMAGQKYPVYDPTIFIPLGSKISLMQEIKSQGYKLIFATFDSAVLTDVYSSEFNSQEPLTVGIYKGDDQNFITIERSVKVVGVPNGVPANMKTPFKDISYFGEPYMARAAYGVPYTVIYSDVIRDDIAWLYEQGITTGTSATTFSPGSYVTRNQMVQFLWNYSGKPEPQKTQNPFEDVKESDWFYKAVMWAYENGITAGISKTEFGSSKICTDLQAVALLSRMFNCELPDSIYDEKVDNMSLSRGNCMRANMAHYFHYAYEYAKNLST